MKRLGDCTDAELVTRVRAGERDAFSEIARRHRAHLLACTGRFLPAGEAEDAVQDALLLALRALERDGRPLVLRPWLAVIARNRALDLVRRHRATGELPPGLPDRSADVVDLVARRQELSRTVRQLSELSERQRTALVGQAFEGATVRQLAERLDTSDQAVKALVHRARTALARAA